MLQLYYKYLEILVYNLDIMIVANILLFTQFDILEDFYYCTISPAVHVFMPCTISPAEWSQV